MAGDRVDADDPAALVPDARPPGPPPPGMIAVPMGKGCWGLLYVSEAAKILRRGKRWRRALAAARAVTRPATAR